ncbi:MAG TPA: hypothetical protein DCP92_16485 [Nitrospiraceae bacterium]|nr:hypothetical protein [Nitrospiraceae bacterium]
MLASFFDCLALVTNNSPTGAVPLSSGSLYSLVIYETSVLAVISVFLKYRGWSKADFNLKISGRLFFAGLLLFLTYYAFVVLIYAFSASLCSSIKFFDANRIFKIGSLNSYSVIAASIINPIYEEVLLVGYIIGALKGKKGIVFAINISVLFRFLCHLYQGPLAAIEIIPMDLLFAYVYHRWEKLFPLIVAHGILHYIGFLRLSSL